MKVVLFGAAGQLGTDCYQRLNAAGYEVVPLSRDQVDFSDPTAVGESILNTTPDFVINACAYTAVDRAETDAAQADLVNHLSVAEMARCCDQLQIPLLQLSTDYVFAGDGTQPYREDDSVSPLGVYGKTKLAGEVAIQQQHPKHIILRTSWVFGTHGNNFVKTMLRLGGEREQLRVVSDQWGRPTYTGDIVTAIESFLDSYQQQGELPWGIYHCSSEGETNWHEFAQTIFAEAMSANLLQRVPQVEPIPSSAYPTPAPRPHYSVLDTSKLTQFMGSPLPHWRQGLQTFFRQQTVKG